MEFQKAELRKILPQNGWEIEILDNYDYRLFSKETWKLRSLWSPLGSIAYLTFDLDPMEIRPDKEFAWAVTIRREDPGERLGGVFSIPLNHWKDKLPEFLKELSKLREAQL